MILTTAKNQWKVNRSAIATVDWPTATSAYDPVADPTHRLVSRMLDTLEAAIVPLDVGHFMVNGVVLRATFNDNAGTATLHIFGASEGDTSAKYLGSIALVAGTQTNAAGRYYAKTATVTRYSRNTFSVSEDESGTGISEVEFDATIYDRLFFGFSAISASDNVSLETNGY